MADQLNNVDEPTMAPPATSEEPEVQPQREEANVGRTATSEAEVPPPLELPVIDRESSAFGATRSATKVGSSSSSSVKDESRDQEVVSNRQLEILEHLSQDPSTWSPEVIQAITLTHASTVYAMSQDHERDWKLIRNDSISQSPLSSENLIRHRVILFTRLDKDLRISNYVHHYDPTAKSIYFFISKEGGHEQTVNLDFKSKQWEKRVASQRRQLEALENQLADVLNQLCLGHILKGAKKVQEERRNQLLNLLCTMAICVFKELVYSGLVILSSKNGNKEFEKVKRDRDEYFLKVQRQIVMTMYRGLSHLNENGFYIPLLRKDYFVRDTERREVEDLILLQESRRMVKKMKRAHRERSGILTLESPSEVTKELAQLLKEAKQLKKDTPVTIADIEAKNLENFSTRVAEVIQETLGGGRSAEDAARMPPPPPPSKTVPPLAGKGSGKKRSPLMDKEEKQDLVKEMGVIKGMLHELRMEEEQAADNANTSRRLQQRSRADITSQDPVNQQMQAGQEAVSRLRARSESEGVVKGPKAKQTNLGKALGLPDTTALKEQDINLDPEFEDPPPPEARRPIPLDVKTLQDQLQQLRIGPTKSSTPLRGVTTPTPETLELPTPILTKPTGTKPKPGILRTALDDNYQPVVPQPGGNPNSLVSTNLRTRPLNPESDSDDSSDTSEVSTSRLYQTAFETGTQTSQTPALVKYTTALQEINSTLPLNLDNEPETGMGRLNAVIRELFGRDTIKSALMERALVNWIKVESRRQAEQQIVWYRQFHPGTRRHIGYSEDTDEEEEEPSKKPTKAIALKTAAGGGGDPNDPDDDPRRRSKKEDGEERKDQDSGKKGRGDDNFGQDQQGSGSASAGGGGEPPRRPTGLVEGFENPKFLEDDADEDEITAYMRKMFGVRPGEKEADDKEKSTRAKAELEMSLSLQEGGQVDLYKLIDAIKGNGKVAGSTKDLTVPEFHGDLTKWDNFWAIFNAVIDKHPKLSTINKFAKLKDAVKGVAFDAISHIHFSEDNYHLAKKELVNTFGLVDNLLNATSESYRKMAPCQDRDFKQYQKMVQKTNGWLRLLSLHHPRLLADPGMIIKDIENKLPPTIKDNWYRYCTLNQIPLHIPGTPKKLSHLITFMRSELQMKIYQQANTYNQQQQRNNNGNGNNNGQRRNGNGQNHQKKTASNFAATVETGEQSAPTATTVMNIAAVGGQKPNQPSDSAAKMGDRPKKCCFCGQGHPAFKCRSSKPSPKEALAKAKRSKLCIQCLRWGHFVKDCRSKGCTIEGCGKKHHRWLHIKAASSGGNSQ